MNFFSINVQRTCTLSIDRLLRLPPRLPHLLHLLPHHPQPQLPHRRHHRLEFRGSTFLGWATDLLWWFRLTQGLDHLRWTSWRSSLCRCPQRHACCPPYLCCALLSPFFKKKLVSIFPLYCPLLRSCFTRPLCTPHKYASVINPNCQLHTIPSFHSILDGITVSSPSSLYWKVLVSALFLK